MTNQRLRSAMLQAELTANALASAVGVDVKSVNRWIGEDRLPYPITRVRVARVLDQQETYLWPALVQPFETLDDSFDTVRVWPTRSVIPVETWHDLFNSASRQIDILVYAGGFLIEALDLPDVLAAKAATGTTIRVLVGDPQCKAVASRGHELGLSWLPARCQTTYDHVNSIVTRQGSPGASGDAVGLRQHATTLYASLFRFDDALLINTHAFGVWAAQSPTLSIDQQGDSVLFGFYDGAFARVWTS